MKWVFRPTLLVTVSVLLVGAAVLVSLPRDSLARPTAEPVAAGELEIAWIYPATSGSSWELFVRGVQHVGKAARLEVDDRRAFPAQTTAVPAVTLTLPRANPSQGPRRLLFRWYKLTGGWGEPGWMDTLLDREPPPLVVIGGNNSYRARELAVQMHRKASSKWGEDLRRSPLLFLTYATADQVSLEKRPRYHQPGDPDDRRNLHELYPQRTFRFCFTNRQMAQAVTRFIWSRDELRPDFDQLYSVQWEDDVYSQDLAQRFTVESQEAIHHWLHESVLRESLGALGFQAGMVLPAHPLVGPILAELRGWRRPDWEQIHQEASEPIHWMHDLFNPLRIESSVGPFASANIFETDTLSKLLEPLLEKQSLEGTHRPPFPLRPFTTRRPFLVVTGQEQPTRRFLRDLARAAPHTARRCVVATGDVLTFNTIFRDRRVSWPVQDLPFSLVFFCHYNPIDPCLGFPALDPGSSQLELHARADQIEGRPISGTDDQLLPVEIVETLVRVCSPEGTEPVDPESVATRLKALPWSPPAHPSDGPPGKLPLFQPDGQRRGGTGEHVVYLQPRFQGDQVLRQADVEVWSWQASLEGVPRRRVWKRVGKLEVSWKDPLE
jgi:hypothetical protein